MANSNATNSNAKTGNAATGGVTISRWRQRAVVLFGVVVIVAIWAASQSDWAFRNRVNRAGGYLSSQPTAPDWVRERLGENIAAMFDTPSELFLERTIPDGLLERAAEIESLRWLVIEGGQVTDARLRAFRDHPALRGVRLKDTQVTDETLETFASIPQLKSVSLELSLVTPAGIDRFRKRRPDVQLDVDPATEAGLAPFVADGRASFNGVDRRLGGALRLTGPLDESLRAAAGRLRVARLTLEELDADGSLIPLVEDQPLETVLLTNVDVGPEFAAALANSSARELRLQNVVLEPDEAAALFKRPAVPRRTVDDGPVEAPLPRSIWYRRQTGLVLENVTFAPGAAAVVSDCRFDSLTVVGSLTFAPGDRLGEIDVDWLFLGDADIVGDAAAAASLIHAAAKSLSVGNVATSCDAEAFWSACRASSVHVRQDEISAASAAALARLPIDTLSILSTEWTSTAVAELGRLQARSLTIDNLTPAQAQALCDSNVSALVVIQTVSEEVAGQIAGMRSLTALQMTIETPREAELHALADLPHIDDLSLNLMDVGHLGTAFWDDLFARHPRLEGYDWFHRFDDNSGDRQQNYMLRTRPES